MKNTMLGSLAIAGFAALSIGAFNLTNVSAAGVTTTRSQIVRLYNPQGGLVKNRALGPNTAWKVGKTKTINGEKMYQVATSEYVKASETDYDANAGKANTNSNKSNVVLTTDEYGAIAYNDQDGSVHITNNGSRKGSPVIIGSFKVSKIVRNDFGTFYKIANHTWINGNVDGNKSNMLKVQITGNQSNVQYDKNFSPVGKTVLGKSASDIRTMLINDYKCDPNGVAQLSDSLLLTTYADILEFLDEGDNSYVYVLNEINPNVHGISYGTQM